MIIKNWVHLSLYTPNLLPAFLSEVLILRFTHGAEHKGWISRPLVEMCDITHKLILLENIIHVHVYFIG